MLKKWMSVSVFCLLGLSQVALADPAEIIAGQLYLSSANDARDLATLERLGITHIVNLTGKKHGSNELRYPKFPENFPDKNYLHLVIDDAMDTRISDHFDAINRKFIHPALKSHGKVLVHCEAGISRSSTVVIAYLIQGQHKNLTEAYRIVKAAKPNIGPNKAFMEQLIAFELKVLRQAAVPLNLLDYLTDQLLDGPAAGQDRARVRHLLEAHKLDVNAVQAALWE